MTYRSASNTLLVLCSNKVLTLNKCINKSQMIKEISNCALTTNSSHIIQLCRIKVKIILHY